MLFRSVFLQAEDGIRDSPVTGVQTCALPILKYGGDGLEIGALTLTLSGGGIIENTKNLILDNPASIVALNGISQISGLSVTSALTSGKLSIVTDAVIQTFEHTESSKLDISDNASLTIQNEFAVPQNKSMELTGSDNGTLILGDKLTLSGMLIVSAPDKLSGGTLELKGGTLSVNENYLIESAVTHIGHSNINVSSDKTLKYTGNEAQIGALELTLSGGGFIDNANNFALNNPDSKLAMKGIEISKVSFTEDLTNGQLTVDNDSVIKNLTNSKSSRIDIGNGYRLTVENSFEIPANINMQFVGSGSGIMQINDTLTLSGTVKFDAPNYTLDNGTLALKDRKSTRLNSSHW